MKKFFCGVAVLVCLLVLSSCTLTISSGNVNQQINNEDCNSHTPSDAVKENEISASCDKNGSYEKVVYCAECEKELSRVTETLEKTPHQYQNNI